MRIQFVSRRRVVFGAAATLVGARLLPGCDRLVLPDGSLAGEIDPITPNDDFYVTSCCGTIQVDAATWSCGFLDAGVALASFDQAFLESLPARDKEHTLQCIGSSPANQAIGNAIWSGLPLLEVLAAKGVFPREDALELKFTGADGYQTSIPADELPGLWLVWRMNGETLPAAHGYPARILTPGRYGTKNPKWIAAIELVDEPFVGLWESRGWSNDASYLANGLVQGPREGDDVGTSGIVVLGTAFAGDDPIVRVEVTDGEAWRDAEITYEAGPGIWTLWRWDWVPAAPGDYVLKVRVTTASGATSAPQGDATDLYQGYDGSMEVRVRVS